MKIAIFGAIGRTGQHMVQQALAQNYEVVALVRTPSKLTVQNKASKLSGVK
jgi:putative NADH-flavin reductase